MVANKFVSSRSMIDKTISKSGIGKPPFARKVWRWDMATYDQFHV